MLCYLVATYGSTFFSTIAVDPSCEQFNVSCILGTRCFPTVSFYCPLTLSNLFPIEIRAIELATYLAIKLNFPSISHSSIINHVLSSCSLRRYHVDTPVKSYFSSYLHSFLVSSLRPNLMGYYTVIV